MKTIAIVDTSVLCEIIAIPGKSTSSGAYKTQLEHKLRNGEGIALPLTTILETGNHVGHIVDGAARRDRAEKLARLVDDVLARTVPFIPMFYWTEETVRAWCRELPDWVAKESGLGDLTIKQEWDRLCALNPARRVYIWSIDDHLRAFDRSPTR